MQRPLSFVLLGAGGRGRMFSQWLHDHVGPGAVVAVAEPNPLRREAICAEHGIPTDRCFSSWQELLAQPRLADVAINTTMDREHLTSAIAAMQGGYHMLLEKPMATNLDDCVEIDRVRRETGRIVSVCHSLRYHALYEEVRRVLRSGAIGDIVSLDQLEGVEHVHQSHSFVRGNWGNEERSTFMLLAKSCHDLDIIADLVDLPCERVSSYGSLKYFREENAPAGAPEYCVQGCPVAAKCPYYAPKVYGNPNGWASHAGLSGLDHRQLLKVLETSPFGRCVFRTDNDVVDHQVVAMEFEGGVTATFTMTAFTPFQDRVLRIHGTKGYLEARVGKRTLDVWEFWEGNRHTRIELPEAEGAHGGADAQVMRRLIEAIQLEDPSSVTTSTYASLQSHAIVFAAERSRRTGQAVELASSSELSRR
ncbi:Gfo/Idh/MocA family oxidoreductase [bacterium]|nr:MAG: Gfo/Idh/MocA family oxidoreductase [bacterium]